MVSWPENFTLQDLIVKLESAKIDTPTQFTYFIGGIERTLICNGFSIKDDNVWMYFDIPPFGKNLDISNINVLPIGCHAIHTNCCSVEQILKVLKH